MTGPNLIAWAKGMDQPRLGLGFSSSDMGLLSLARAILADEEERKRSDYWLKTNGGVAVSPASEPPSE